MDLYAPVANQNDYGARRKKDLKTGSLSKNSYVPAGLTKAQYEKIRNKDTKKKSDNYERNVAKAGKFSDFYAFYKNRGTDLKDTRALLDGRVRARVPDRSGRSLAGIPFVRRGHQVLGHAGRHHCVVGSAPGPFVGADCADCRPVRQLGFQAEDGWRAGRRHSFRVGAVRGQTRLLR